MTDIVLYSAFAAHLLFCAVLGLLVWRKAVRLPTALFPLVAAVPIFGALCALFAARAKAVEGSGAFEAGPRGPGMDAQQCPVASTGGGPGDPVPFEEAMLIDDAPTRRAVMLELLHGDPEAFFELLMLARLSGDSELTHYATTSILEIQRGWELCAERLQSGAEGGDIGLLDAYLAALKAHIESGLLAGRLLEQKRKLYLNALKRRVELCPDLDETYFQIADAALGMKDFVCASETARYLQQRHPENEDAWLLGLRICVEAGDSCEKAALLERIAISPVAWTKKGRAQMMFWYGESEDAPTARQTRETA